MVKHLLHPHLSALQPVRFATAIVCVSQARPALRLRWQQAGRWKPPKQEKVEQLAYPSRDALIAPHLLRSCRANPKNLFHKKYHLTDRVVKLLLKTSQQFELRAIGLAISQDFNQNFNQDFNQV